MKIDKPSYIEAKNYFYSNRNYFNMLSGFYALHDRKYHEEVFVRIESEYSAGKSEPAYRSGNLLFISASFLVIMIFYMLPLDLKTDDTIFTKESCSIEITVNDNSYFERALIKFNKGRFTRAKEYLLNVGSDDENYNTAQELLKVIDNKIDEEGLTDTENDTYDYPVF